jgi:hypothetical protein
MASSHEQQQLMARHESLLAVEVVESHLHVNWRRCQQLSRMCSEMA